MAGFEPARPCGQRILSPSCMPIPPHAQGQLPLQPVFEAGTSLSIYAPGMCFHSRGQWPRTNGPHGARRRPAPGHASLQQPADDCHPGIREPGSGKENRRFTEQHTSGTDNQISLRQAEHTSVFVFEQRAPLFGSWIQWRKTGPHSPVHSATGSLETCRSRQRVRGLQIPRFSAAIFWTRKGQAR